MLFTDSPLGEMSPKNGTYPSGFDRPPWSLSARGFEVTRVRVGFHMLRPATPFTDGFIRHDHAAFHQQLFPIAEAQAEPKVQPHGVADDVAGNPVILIVTVWR